MGKNNILALKILIYFVSILFMPALLSGAGSSEQNRNQNQGKAARAQFVPDEIIIKLKPRAQEEVSITVDANKNVATGLASMDKLNRKYGITKMKRILDKVGRKPKRKLTPRAEQMRQDLLRIYRIKLKIGTNVFEAISEYQKDPNVEYAEPNYIYRINATIPNELEFDRLWGLHNTGQTGGTPDADIDAPEAWEITTGSSEVIIAVIDTGVDYNHEDLLANMWVNPGEDLNGNGIVDPSDFNEVDDDNNGYVDDVYGINATIPDDGDPMDDNGHGTHCAGTIGAVGNNGTGVVGVNWDVSIMALKYLDSIGVGSASGAITCVDYAINMGAHVMSNSWGGVGYSESLKDTIEAANAAGILFIAAAGNDNGSNNDKILFYPAGYDNDNIIAVGSTDRNDNLAAHSNIGLTTVDVAAPGEDIFSTLLPGSHLSGTCHDDDGDGYGECTGTSMAAPHVSGLVALVWAEYGLAFGHMNVKARLMRTVDHIPALERKMLTEGRINAYRALTETLTLTGPHIYSLSPNVGKAGRSVTIFGDNFDETQGSSYVAFYPWINSTITSWSNTHIECTVPDGCATGEVTVTTAEGTSNGKLFRLGSTIHVDDDACPGTGSGIEADPYCSIQYAIDAATDGDEVLVHDGTYEEDINFKGKVINIRSENGPYVTTIDGGGNGSVVTFDSGEGEYSVLDGLTITNGSGTGGLFGGGIYCSKSYPTISNCTISGNSAGMSGGGIYCSISCPTITNCTISGNSAGESGGGIRSYYNSCPTITNCTISGNSAGESGGGIESRSNSLPTITNCIISGNSVDNKYGGGIYCYLSSPKITNCTISGNSAAGPDSAGGIGCFDSSPTVVNSILWGNTTGGSGNEVYFYGTSSSVDITYSAIEGGWGTQEWMQINHILNADPLFLDQRDALEAPTSDGCYRLQADSPCIDAANSDPPAPTTDKCGNPRYDAPYTSNSGTGANGPYYDMGAYEYGIYCPITATVQGGQTPGVKCPPFTGDPMVKNGGFTITPDGFDPGHTQPLGDGVNEGTSWRFDFTEDPEFQCFPTSLPLASALLTLELTPKDSLISTDAFTIDMLSPIITPAIQNLPFYETRTIQIELTDFYPNRALPDLLKAKNGSIPAFYADDAIVSFAELTLTSFPGEKVNDRFPDLGPEDVDTDFDVTPCAENCVGTFTITAEFKNRSSATLSDLFFEVIDLTGGNVLCNADGGVPWGYGADLTVPMNGELKSQESFTVIFEIGLRSMRPFIFKVDLFGKVQK